MRYGIICFPTCCSSQKSAAEYGAESLSLTQRADELGFRSVKAVEHYANPYGGYRPSPIPFLAAAAQRTERIRLVTGAVVPAFTHPVRLASELTLLDALSGGRLGVGFARAFLPHEFDILV
jgi:alkanesulfonate monooxygenase SsuD/methylene tetrahydromethanopterin reductase-like flavin-dependent oxidoreductase (luciferase family)